MTDTTTTTTTTVSVHVGLTTPAGRWIELDAVVLAVTTLLTDVYSVSVGDGSYQFVDGSSIENEPCLTVLGVTDMTRAELADKLALVARMFGQESVGLVYNVTGADSLVFA
jgi:hypothetical protein